MLDTGDLSRMRLNLHQEVPRLGECDDPSAKAGGTSTQIWGYSGY